MKSILIVLTSSYLASCLPPPHPAVVQVRREEEQLPFHLRSKALWNPHLQEVLPLSSLLHEGEKPVFDREADHVSRQEIYNILTHAGFLPRRHPQYQPDPHHMNHQRTKSKQNHHHHAQPQQFHGQLNGPQFGHQQIGSQHYGSFHQPHFDQGQFGSYLENPDVLQYL